MRINILTITLLAGFSLSPFIQNAYGYERITQFLNERAMELYQSGRSDEAISEFKKILAIDPANPTALEYLQRLGSAAEDKSQAVVRQQTSLLEDEISIMEHQDQIRQKFVQQTRAENDLLRTEIDRKDNQIAVLQKEVNQLYVQLNSPRDQLNQAAQMLLKKDIAAYEILTTNLKAEVNELRADLAKKDEHYLGEIVNLQNRLRGMTNKLAGMKLDLVEKEREMEKIKDMVKSAEAISTEASSQVRATNTALKTELQSLETKLNEKTELLENKDQVIRKLSEEIQKNVVEAKDSAVRKENIVLQQELSETQVALEEKILLLKNKDNIIERLSSKIEDELKNNKNDLREKLALLEQKESKLQGLNTDLESKLAGLQGQLAEKDKALNEKNSVLQALRAEMSQETGLLGDQLKTKTALLDDKEKTIRHLSAKLAQLNDDISRLEVQRADVVAQAEKVENLMRDLNLREDEISHLKKLLLSKNEIVQAYQDKLRMSEDALKDNGIQLAALKNEISELKNKKQSLPQKTDHSAVVHPLKEEIAALQKQLEQSRMESQKKDQAISSLQAMTESLKAQMAAAYPPAQDQENQKQISDLQALIKEKNDLIAKMEKDITKYAQEAKKSGSVAVAKADPSLQRELDALKAEFSSTMTLLDEKENMIKNLTDQIVQLNVQAAEEQKRQEMAAQEENPETAALQKQIEETKVLLFDLEMRLGEKDDEIAFLERELSDTEQRLELVQRIIQEKDSTIEKLEAELNQLQGTGNTADQ